MSDQFEGRETAGGSGLVPTGPGEAAAELADERGVQPGVERGGEPYADDIVDAEVVPDEAPVLRGSPPWVGVLTGAGLGLVVIQVLVLLGTFTQALAVEGFQGNFVQKVGLALLSNVGSANGLTLLVAVVLAGLPSLVGGTVGEAQRRRQALVFAVGAILAVLLIVGTPAAVWARIHVIETGGQQVNALARRVLATYVAGTLGTALVALAAALGLSRHSKTVTPSP